MTLKDLWMLYEADKRILGFSTHGIKFPGIFIEQEYFGRGVNILADT
jgi:hypothetical protein